MVNKITTFLIKYFLWILPGWVLIHIFSITGIFVLVLFFCYISFARLGFFWKVIQKRAFWGVAIIFLIFIFSLAFVWFESLILKDFGYPKLPKIAVFEVPKKGEYLLGEIFPFEIRISDIEMPINAVQADISFDPETVEIVDISTENSFANIFIQKEINNSLGFARFSGGLPNPGFSGKEGVFGTVYFIGKKPGITTVEFLSSSKVLANDGSGSNLLKELPSVNFLILPDKTDELQAIQVLGESSSSTKMIFYEEPGKKLDSGAQKTEENLSPANKGLELIARFDNYVVSFWLRVLEKVFRR